MDKTQKWASGWNSQMLPGRVFASRSALLAAISKQGGIGYMSPEMIRGSFEKIKDELAGKYQAVGLSFGYLGNIWPDAEDDRSFYFFTKVPHPDGHGRFKYELGNIEELKSLDAESLMPKLEEWIVKKVLPHARPASPKQGQ